LCPGLESLNPEH